MNNHILNTEIQDFINKNINSDVLNLLLKGTTFNDVETREIVEQIEAKKKSKLKLPTWFKTKSIYYCNKLNIEQTSSEITAKYKSKLISGSSIIDVTGGFGVDSYYFSKHFKNVTHCEINETLSSIVAHNFKQLQKENINILCADGIAYLKQSKDTFDWLYIDPSRRNELKGKVFFLNDCLPNVPENIELLFKTSENILIKTSPLLDISIGIKELKYVKEIQIVAINNEVKELLWVLRKSVRDDNILINTVNINKTNESKFSFYLKEEPKARIAYSDPLNYLYEPNASILKSGAYKIIAQKFKVLKLQQHSHLYTSELLVDFPGRVFKINTIVTYNKWKTLNISHANITTRNFPDSVEQIRKKLKIKDGGNIYIFATTTINQGKVLIICSKTH